MVDVAGDRVGQGEGHGDQVEHRLVPVRPTQDGLGNPVIIRVLPWCKIEALIIGGKKGYHLWSQRSISSRRRYTTGGL